MSKEVRNPELELERVPAAAPLIRRTCVRTLIRFAKRLMIMLVTSNDPDWVSSIVEHLSASGQASSSQTMSWEVTEGMRQYRLTGAVRWPAIQWAATFVEALGLYADYSAAPKYKLKRQAERDHVRYCAIGLFETARHALSEVVVTELFVTTRWPMLSTDVHDAVVVAIMARGNNVEMLVKAFESSL